MPATKTKPTPKRGSLEAWIARHPYVTISLSIHFVLISFALNHVDWFTPKLTHTAEYELAREYTRQSRHQAIRERVEDMEAVKQILEQINNQASTPAPDEMDTSSASPQELLNKSNDLLQEIRDMNDAALQEKLDALAQDEEQQPESDQQQDVAEVEPEPELAENQLTDEQILQVVANNQQEARALFGKMMRSEKAKQDGHSANTDGGQGEGEGEEGTGSGDSVADFGNRVGNRVGDGIGAGGMLDPNNPLSVENHFSQFARGSVGDLSDEMQNMYSARSGNTVKSAETMAKDLGAPRLDYQQRLFFSRKLSESGTTAQWVVLDSWYFIGPFPNPGRINIDTRFPPELGIDLNAIYTGENDRLIRWEYIQYKHLPIIPADFTDYAVYYAYTELVSQTPRSVWLAIGSDDQSKLWVNDMLVWRSSDQEKVWTINEGYRKIQLQAGRNKFLFRLENGIQRAAFSVVMTDAED